MSMKRIFIACLLGGAVAWSAASASAQTDVAGSVDGAFSGATKSGTPQTGEVTQHSSDSVGGLLEVRHIHNALVGFEGAYAYSYHRVNQTYSYTSTVYPPTTPCPISPAGIIVNCPTGPIVSSAVSSVSANAHAITAAWVLSRKMRNFRSFALVGGGLLIFVPSGGQPGTHSATKPMFQFGAGLDWGISSHFGLRLQDRESIYKSPQLISSLRETYQGSYIASQPFKYGFTSYTQEPAIGIYYRF